MLCQISPVPIAPTIISPDQPRESASRQPFHIDTPVMTDAFYLVAHERMTYLSARPIRGDAFGWWAHRFVSFEGRLIVIRLPPDARIFLWTVGTGPTPFNSVCCRRRRWGQIPRSSSGVDGELAERLARLRQRSQI